MVTEVEVRAVLEQVIHPSFGTSLVALGMVRAVRVSESGIEVDLVMNCPGCPGAEAALALAWKTLRTLNGTGTVSLSLLPQVWTPPWE